MEEDGCIVQLAEQRKPCLHQLQLVQLQHVSLRALFPGARDCHCIAGTLARRGCSEFLAQAISAFSEVGGLLEQKKGKPGVLALHCANRGSCPKLGGGGGGKNQEKLMETSG